MLKPRDPARRREVEAALLPACPASISKGVHGRRVGAVEGCFALPDIAHVRTSGSKRGFKWMLPIATTKMAGNDPTMRPRNYPCGDKDDDRNFNVPVDASDFLVALTKDERG